MALKSRGEEWEEYDHAVQWMVMTVVITLVVTTILAIVSMPLGYLIGSGISKDSLSDVSRFISTVFDNPSYLFSRYWNWFRQLSAYHGSFSVSLWLPILPIIALPSGLIIGAVTNPYRFQSNIHGSARIAEYKDIKKMGLFDGFCMVVGKYKGRLLMLKETLSTLCCAPPGTGKTVGVVIPTIFNSHGLSIVVNDPKPELCYSTTGARAKDGPVFVINWGAEDNPAEGIYYPSWNPLSPNALPAPGPDRDMYVDSMCNILVEDPKGGADPHWSKTGRAALTGFIHFIASKCERARANDYFIGRIYEGKLDEEDKRVLEGYYLDMRDPMSARAIQNLRNNSITIDNYLPIGTWQLLPEKWIGHESCLAMILEWITEAQIKQAQDIKRRIEEGDQMAAMSDPMRTMLEEAVDEASGLLRPVFLREIFLRERAELRRLAVVARALFAGELVAAFRIAPGERLHERFAVLPVAEVEMRVAPAGNRLPQRRVKPVSQLVLFDGRDPFVEAAFRLRARERVHRAGNGGNHDAREQTDDADDDEQFDEGESVSFFHKDVGMRCGVQDGRNF